MLYRCPYGCEEEIGMSARSGPAPRCKRHGEPLVYEKQLGRSSTRRSSLKSNQRRETKAEREARQHFNAVVKGWPCFFRGRRPCGRCEGSGEVLVPLYYAGRYYGDSPATCSACNGAGQHHCSGPKDSHHLVEQQWIRRNYADLPEDKLLAILFCPQIGAPLCRSAHDAIKQHRIYWHELTPECIDFCAEVDDLYFALPTPYGAQRESMSGRLRLECPERDRVSEVAG